MSEFNFIGIYIDFFNPTAGLTILATCEEGGKTYSELNSDVIQLYWQKHDNANDLLKYIDAKYALRTMWHDELYTMLITPRINICDLIQMIKEHRISTKIVRTIYIHISKVSFGDLNKNIKTYWPSTNPEIAINDNYYHITFKHPIENSSIDNVYYTLA